MYLTAQRVLSAEGAEAVNAYHYRHGADFAWPDDASALPDEAPGALVERREDVPPGGNRVRSWLDVLAPDGTVAVTLRFALDTFRRNLEEFPNPAVFRQGPVTVRFGVEIPQEPRWADALAELMEALEGFVS